MSNRAASRRACAVHGLIIGLLASRSQALPIWTLEELQFHLRQLGHYLALRSIRRHVDLIRDSSKRE